MHSSALNYHITPGSVDNPRPAHVLRRLAAAVTVPVLVSVPMQIVQTPRDELADRRHQHSRFEPPSTYGLSHRELNREVIRCRREGWQMWEVRVRFGLRRPA